MFLDNVILLNETKDHLRIIREERGGYRVEDYRGLPDDHPRIPKKSDRVSDY